MDPAEQQSTSKNAAGQAAPTNEEQDELAKLREENANLKKTVAKLREENANLKKTVAKLREEKAKEKKKVTIYAPIREEDAAAFIFIKFDSIELKKNIWDILACGVQLTISEEGLFVISTELGRYTVRAVLPIPQPDRNADAPYIIFYFEVEIVHQKNGSLDVFVGFCDDKFPLDWGLNDVYGGAVAIWTKNELHIIGHKPFKIGNGGEFEEEEAFQDGDEIDDRESDFCPFRDGDVVGLGLIHYPNPAARAECFATCNGELLGKAPMAPEYPKTVLYPAVSLNGNSTSIRANFGRQEWRYNPIKLLGTEV